MLSSQINFYVLPEELFGIQQWLKERDIVCVKTDVYDHVIAKLDAPSRFYFTKQYFDRTTQEFIEKDEEYVKWAMKIYRDFKKRFFCEI